MRARSARHLERRRQLHLVVRRPTGQPTLLGSPLALDPLRARVMLEHPSATVDGFLILAPTPVRIEPLVLPTAPALLGVMMPTLVILVDGPSAPIAPYDHGLRWRFSIALLVQSARLLTNRGYPTLDAASRMVRRTPRSAAKRLSMKTANLGRLPASVRFVSCISLFACTAPHRPSRTQETFDSWASSASGTNKTSHVYEPSSKVCVADR
jgi:hypothetical protein